MTIDNIEGKFKPVNLEVGYKPCVNEEYMNPKQLTYFYNKLVNWRKELEEETATIYEHLQQENFHKPDMSDMAAIEGEMFIELRSTDRIRKLQERIDAAIQRINDGSYGYCVSTGEEIGLARLEVRPIATMCIKAQEEHERFEKDHSDEV